MEEFLTVAEVAAMLTLNQQTVRNWIDDGMLPAYRVGRRVRISRSDFDRLVAARYTGESTGSPSTAEDPARASIWDGEVPPPQPPGATSAE